MRTLLFSILAVVAILSGSTLAVKGVISDTLTSDEEGCLSLCGLNDACLLALYQTECRECWLMDCSLQFMPVGFTGGGKDTIKIKPTCDSALVPKPREDGCKDAPAATTSAAAATTTSAATATTTSGAARSSETGVKASATWRTSIDWLPLGAVVMANIVVAT